MGERADQPEAGEVSASDGGSHFDVTPHDRPRTIRIVMAGQRVIWTEPFLHVGARVQLIPVRRAVQAVLLAPVCALLGHRLARGEVLEGSPVPDASSREWPPDHVAVLKPVDGGPTTYVVEEHVRPVCATCGQILGTGPDRFVADGSA